MLNDLASDWSSRDHEREHFIPFLAWTAHAPTADRDREPDPEHTVAEPERHFRFDDEGITDDVVEGRRPSSYFMPIPKAKRKGGQLVFDEWTGDRIEENRLIPDP